MASAAVLGGLLALAPAATAVVTAKKTTATHVNCNSTQVHAGHALHCGVSVSTVSGSGTVATGSVALTTNLGAGHGTLSTRSCTLVPVNRRTARCTFTYTPKQAQTVAIYANYTGDATHAASHAKKSVVVLR